MVKKLKKPSTQPTKQSTPTTPKKPAFDTVQLKKASVSVKEETPTTRVQDMEKVEMCDETVLRNLGGASDLQQDGTTGFLNSRQRKTDKKWVDMEKL